MTQEKQNEIMNALVELHALCTQSKVELIVFMNKSKMGFEGTIGTSVVGNSDESVIDLLEKGTAGLVTALQEEELEQKQQSSPEKALDELFRKFKTSKN